MTNNYDTATAVLPALIADSCLPPRSRTAQFTVANDDETTTLARPAIVHASRRP